MSNEKLNEEPGVEAAESSNAAETPIAEEAQAAPKRKRKKGAIAGIVVGVVVVLAVGFWVWHNTPGFCDNPVCHDSMNAFVDTYGYEAGIAGADKWGNEVTDAQAMLVVSHKSSGTSCLDCHIANLDQQIGEVKATLDKSYTMPLAERSACELLDNSNRAYASETGDEFCLNESCHNVTRDDLKRALGNTIVDGSSFNPHNPPTFVEVNGERVDHPTFDSYACTDCHKSHRASVLMCTGCHNADAPGTADFTGAMPDGWVDYKTGKQISEDAIG